MTNTGKRPHPTKQLLIEVCGGNQSLIESVHHGLVETPLQRFYPYLDFDETIAFAASSWKDRKKRPDYLNRLIEHKFLDIHQIFSTVFKIGFPWLNKYKNISDELKEKYEKLNPFQGKNLRERLENVPSDAVFALGKRLVEEVNEYIFECEYEEKMKQFRQGTDEHGRKDNYKLVVMDFQPVYPREGRIVPAYAKDIARILREYPQEYSLESMETRAEPEEVKSVKVEQSALFK